MNRELFDLVVEHDEIADLDPAQRRVVLRDLLAARCNGDLPERLREVAETIDGYGPLTSLMAEDVTDVLVNGPGEVWIDSGRGLSRTDVTLEPGELFALIQRLVGDAGGRIDATRPIADARLGDGSRLHAVLPPLAPEGPLVSIRRFPETPMSLDELAASGMFDDDTRRGLAGAVAERRSILISGATGSGKTTLLNALLGLVSPSERVVVIEETPELRPGCAHSVSLVARPPNVEDRGEVTLSDLVRASLRMRPDRIVVGEVRGAEALVALGALSTGHEGSLLTVHARSARHSIDRLVALALEAGGGETEEVLRRRAEEAIDLRVHVARVDGIRRVVEVEG